MAGMVVEDKLAGLPPEEVLRRGRKLLQGLRNTVVSEQPPVGRYTGTAVCFGPEIARLFDFLVVALLADGHVLVRANVGVGKTLACSALARAVGGHSVRVQCLPDMLPCSLTGFTVFNPQTKVWEVRHGPLYGSDEARTNIVLADEINRTTPKTQAALLEAMSERRVTIDTRSYELPPVWMVLATRNPIEHEGTFDLPEAMLDRCLGQCDIAPPSVETLVRIIRAPDYERQMSERLERIPSIVSIADIVALRRAIFSKTADPAGDYIYVDGRIDRYIAALVVKTWEHKAVAVGSSPRGAENLKKVATVVAYLAGYDFVAPQHVLRFIDPVLAHRIFLNPSERLRYGGEFRTADVVSEVVRSVPEPPVDAVRRREGIPRCQ